MAVFWKYEWICVCHRYRNAWDCIHEPENTAGIWFTISSTVILAAGSMFILWLGERITDKGVGNGISFIILVGIIARLPHSLFKEFVSRTSEKTGGLVMF